VRYIVGSLFAFLLAIVQASSIEQFHVFGVSPNLMLVMLVCWLVVRGLDDVLPMVAVCGITLGLVGLQAPGLVLLALLTAIAAAGFIRELHIIHSEAVLTALLVLGASLIYESILLAGLMATGGPLEPVAGAREIIVPAAILNLIITPPAYLIMRLGRPADARRRNAYVL
jgi:hypothetical protein